VLSNLILILSNSLVLWTKILKSSIIFVNSFVYLSSIVKEKPDYRLVFLFSLVKKLKIYVTFFFISLDFSLATYLYFIFYYAIAAVNAFLLFLDIYGFLLSSRSSLGS
jgi:hypothetical protein